MRQRLVVLGILAVVGFSTGADLLACGDKFLVSSRGTRYQRPKTARAASVLIYADAASGIPSALKKIRASALLKHEGHRASTVEAPDQLTAIVAGGRFDVVIAARSAAQDVERLLGPAPDRAIVVTIDERTKPGSLLEAIDKAVAMRDQNVRRAQTRS
jgi:hypothetical protein